MDANWVHDLAAVAVRAPSADNSQPWELQWNGNALDIVYAQRNKTHSVFTENSHATLLSVGAVVEHVQSALAANAMPATWQWPANPALGRPYVSLPLKEASAKFIAPPGPLQRHTNRGPFHRTPIPDDVVRDFSLRQENDNRMALLVDRPQKANLVRLVQLCSEARFCNQRLHEWLISSLRFTPDEVARGDGLDVDALCLPPGGKQFLRFTSDWRRLAALNRLGAYKLLALSEVALLSAAPGLLCVIGRADTRSVIDAGIFLSRAWTDLNMKGIAVHPYYVVSDQINRLQDGTIAMGFQEKITVVETQLRQLLALQPGEILHMILRVGYRKAMPVRSKRLALESILDDRSR